MREEAFAIDLSGTWALASADGAERLSMAVPGDVVSALERAGRIPDPYFGANEKALQWICRKDWVLSRTVILDEGDLTAPFYLDIDYLDTVATVKINGTAVLFADNCFLRYRPDVTSALVAGVNTIEITLHSPVEAGRAVYETLPFPVPWLAMNCPIPYGNMLRKPQCHFGWDWNIALAPSGLYGTIALKRLDTVRIEHVTTRQAHHSDGTVDLEVEVDLFSVDPVIVPVTIEFNGETVRLDCGTQAGRTLIRHVFTVDKPALWWPAGQGDQPLFTLSVTAGGETVERRIGLRRVELLTDKDQAGSRFAFRINGREIFAKGANWIPADALFSRTSRDKTVALLESAVDANMNMIRIWGGGFYESQWFYDECDRLGLMVWQDFMFACNLYPSTDAFLDNVAREVDYQVKRLSHHASIVIWCGDNELVGALNWFEVSKTNRDRYLVSYDRLNRTIETALKACRLDTIWWPSSPSCGALDFGDAWHSDGSGDMHFWSVWHENKSFDHYRTVRPRFCSEFGFQSYTSMPVVKTYAASKDLNIASPVMEVHQKNPGGNERIAGTMFRYFRFPKDFENFVYLSQVQQALAIKTAVEWWRSLKPHCMGTIIWQLNDTWPVASWASLDYGGNWKLLHHLASHFFAPVAVAAIPSPDGATLSFSAVNDTTAATTVRMEVDLVDLKGRRTTLTRPEGMVGPDAASVIGALSLTDIPEGHLIAWRWTAANGARGEGHHVVETYKVLDLSDPGLALESRALPEGRYEVSVSAAGLALFVALEADRPGRFSDNGFDLMAGERRAIIFTPDDRQGEAPAFRLFDLFSCQATG